MNQRKGFFLADGLLALLVFLIGTAAIQTVLKSTARARLDHQMHQRAWSILADAESWPPEDAGVSWKRGFNFQGEAVTKGIVFLLRCHSEATDSQRKVRYQISYQDASGEQRRQWREHDYWAGHDAGF